MQNLISLLLNLVTAMPGLEFEAVGSVWAQTLKKPSVPSIQSSLLRVLKTSITFTLHAVPLLSKVESGHPVLVRH